MFFTYLWNELRRRRKQTLVVALGLAFGIGLVVSVSAMATGVKQAQSTVLHSLYGVGTDITVTTSGSTGGGPAGFQVGGSGGFSRDQIVATPGLQTMKASAATKIRQLGGVSVSAGGLSLTSIHFSGKLPTIPPTGGATAPSGSSTSSGQPSSFKVDTISIAGVDVTSQSVGALSPTQVHSGRAFAASDAKSKIVILDQGYAKQQGVSVGDTFTLGGKDFKVIGVAQAPAGSTGSNVYIPLSQAQSLAGSAGEINRVYVKASSSTRIQQVKEEIVAAYPKATVTTASDLASQVSGSLSSASNLATKLGTWLSIAALIAAVVIASLLTLSAVGRRTREFGTLKAIGWRSRRVVAQVMGESLVQGLIGGALGLALGVGGAALVEKLAPSLTASVSTAGTGGGGFPGPGGGAGGANPFVRTVNVALHAPIGLNLALLAIGLAVAGGVLAGAAGGWRASRLRPADAMRQIV